MKLAGPILSIIGIVSITAFILDRFNLLKKYTGTSLRDVASALLKPQQEYYISKLAKPVRQRYRDLIKKIEATGYSVILTSGTRTFEDEGNDTSGHVYGIAIDINLQKGASYWRKATPYLEWEATGVPAIIRAEGFRTGVDFTSYGANRDPVHIDLKNVYNTNNLRQQAIATYGSNLTSMNISGVEFVV